jgi:sugar lactone lactonase YvrE
LNAPKGMGIYKGILWVADIDQIVGINTITGVIEKRINVPGASFLNDITVDNKGVVYVSDTGGKKVYAIENGKVTTVQDYLQGPNGLLAVGDDLYILDNGSLMKLGKDKKLTKVADGMESSTDGLEMVDDKDFIASCWAGTIYYIKADGSKQKMLDTRDKKINSADIGFDPVKKIVYVPTFAKNSITAYALK